MRILPIRNLWWICWFLMPIEQNKVYSLLFQQGSNPEKEHVIEHLFIGENGKLQSLSDQLTADGFYLVSLNDDRLTLTKSAMLTAGEISDFTEKLAGNTASIGIKYEGWGAEIVK